MIKETIVDDIYAPKPEKKPKKTKITYDDFCEIFPGHYIHVCCDDIYFSYCSS